MTERVNENQTKKYDFQTFSFLRELGVVPVTRLKYLLN